MRNTICEKNFSLVSLYELALIHFLIQTLRPPIIVVNYMHWMTVALALSEGICSRDKALHFDNDTFCDFTKGNGRWNCTQAHF